ncbi:MAG: DUF1287 domain-containing protein [Pseudomonadota bacterium]
MTGPRQLILLTALSVCLAWPAARAAPVTARDVVAAARERLNHVVRYDGSYRRLDYPMGDVPEHVGVCSDLVVRAYRGVGIDLQQLMHEDMQRRFSAYPTRWGLKRPDRNIDHRRVLNIARYLALQGAALPLSRDPASYRPGDLVTWMLPGDLPHIGVVSDRYVPGTRRPLIVHNIGAGPV